MKQAEEHFERGINYFRDGFFTAAFAEFGLVKKIDPDFPNIDYMLQASGRRSDEMAGRLSAFIDENFDDQIKELSEQLEIVGSTSLANTIESMLALGNIEPALKKLETAGTIVPDSKPLLLLNANVKRRIGRLDEAEKTLLRARALFPGDPLVLNNLANIYMEKGLCRDSERLLEEALLALPGDVRILNNLAILKMRNYRLDDAKTLFVTALKRGAKLPVVRNNLSGLTVRIADLDSEISRLRADYAAHPGYADIGLALGKALMFRGFHQEALSILSNVISLNPNLVSAYFFLGTIHEIDGRIADAIEAFRLMVVRSGKSGTPEFKTFDSLYRQGYNEEALAELKKAAVLELDYAAGRINLGIRYFEDALWDDAFRHFKEASEINENYPDAFYWMALCKMQQNKKSAAMKFLQKALAINPKYADAHFQLGMLLTAKSPNKSREHLKKALELGLRRSYSIIADRHLK